MRGVETSHQVPSLPGMVSSETGRTLNRPRQIYRISGIGTAVHYNVHNNSLNNLRRGIAERVLYLRDGDQYTRTYQPPARVFNSMLRPFRRKLLKYLPETTPIRRDQFPTLYSGRKRARYEAAVLSLSLWAVEYRDAWITAFVKAEKIPFSLKPDPAPRIIQPRDPRYNVEVGKYLKPNEKKFYRAVDKVWKSKTIAKGLNSSQRGQLVESHWLSFLKPVAVGLDASRFDQHVSESALRWEHSLYNESFKSPELKELLSWQVRNKCVGRAKDGRVAYQTRGCRMSGDMNTAMGNCLLMSAMVYCYCESKAVTAKLINDGDDCVVFMESADLERFSNGLEDYFKLLGFTMKVEDPVYTIEHIEFCQCNPIWTPDGYIMVRKLPHSLAKDSVCLKPLDTEKVFKKWCGEVGKCGLSLTGGLPILDSFYNVLIRASCGVSTESISRDPIFETGMAFMARGMNRTSSPVADRTRFSFYLAFGVQPDLQVLWERHYDEMVLRYASPGPAIETSPSFTLLALPQCYQVYQ